MLEQRLEAVCEDAASARWIYVAFVVAALALAAWRHARVRSGPGSRALGTGLMLLLLAAAVFDGPPVPLLIGALGAILAIVRPSGSGRKRGLPESAR
jgi:hypothetical protein